MKKFLSLVLALVMTMSLVTVSAGAKDFTDSSKIQYKDAIDVMSAVKVIDGYADGSFNPSTTLTRGAAAKIICNLILGPTTASALVADAAPYKDVPANHTFAGYIAYCQKEGIISGYADGTFRPAATLTGYAFMKMLLGALGYDATIEGYTGANWSINVAKRALNIGLDDGLVGDFNGVKAVTREEACLYAFNTLDSDMVEYDSTTNITVGGATVVIAGSKASVVAQTGYKDTMDDGLNVHTLQFAEKYFPDLKKVGGVSDNMDRPATSWKLKNVEITKITKTPDASYTVEVNGKTLYKDLSLSKKIEAANVDVYTDGGSVTHTQAIAKGDEDTKFGGKGIQTEVYLQKDADGDVVGATVCVIKNYVGKLTVSKNSDGDRVVKVNGLSYKTEEFEKDDVVLYTQDSNAAAADRIQTMVLLTKETGKLTKITDGKYTIDGTVYTASKNAAINSDVDVKDEVDFYVYNNYIVKMDEAEDNFSADDAAVVLKKGNDRGGDWAKLLFVDGTVKVVDLAKDYATGASGSSALDDYDKSNTQMATGDVIKATKQDNGTYKCVYKDTMVSGKTIDNDVPTVNGVAVDSKTIFVYDFDGEDSTQVVTGYKNAMDTRTGTATVGVYRKNNTSAAAVVFVQMAKTDVSASNKDRVIIAYKNSTKVTTEADVADYYEYNAVVNGEITTVKINANNWAALDAAATIAAGETKYGYVALEKTTKDTDGISSFSAGDVTAWTANAPVSSSNIVKFANDVVTVGTTGMKAAKDIVVVFVHENTLTVGTVEDIEEDKTGDIYTNVAYKYDSIDKELDCIVLYQK